MELVALKAFRYGSPRREIRRGETFRSVTDSDAKVLIAARLADRLAPVATYETTAIMDAPVVKREPRGRRER